MNGNRQQNVSLEAEKTSLPAVYFGVLLFGYLMFVGYASFYITKGISLSQTVHSDPGKLFFLSGEIQLGFSNLRDISTNILLYMPLGFLVALYIASKDKLNGLGINLFWGVIISVIVETVQAFIGRVSDITDVISNGTGYLLGFLIAHFSVNRLGLSPAAMLGLETRVRGEKLNTLIGLRFIYIVITILVALLPFDLNVSVSGIYGKLQSTGSSMPRLIVDPLFHLRNGVEHIRYLTLKVLMFLPLAYLSSAILSLRKEPSFLLPAFHCLLLGLTIEFSNLFVESGRSDVIVPIIGFLSGMSVAYLVCYFNSQFSHTTGIAVHRERQYLLVSILFIYCLFVLSYALSPFEFELSLQSIRHKLASDVNLVPFLSHFSNRSIESAVDIMREFMLYVPGGVMLTLCLRNLSFALSFKQISVLILIAGFCFASWIEILQLAVVDRYPDITDVILATLGSIGGCLMAPLFNLNS